MLAMLQQCLLVTHHLGCNADIVRRSGILRGHDSSTGASNGSDQATSVPKPVQDAVDHAMRRLANYLLLGDCNCSKSYWLVLLCSVRRLLRGLSVVTGSHAHSMWQL